MKAKYNMTLNYFQPVFEERNFTPDEFNKMRDDLEAFFAEKGIQLQYIYQGNTNEE